MAYRIYEAVARQSLLGQPVFNVFHWAQEDVTVPPFSDVNYLDVNNAVTGFYSGLKAFLTDQWALEAIAVRALVGFDGPAGLTPQWDIPNVYGGLSGFVGELAYDEGTPATHPLPSEAAMLARFTTIKDANDKRHRLHKYFSGFTEFNQDSGIFPSALCSLIAGLCNTTLNDFIYEGTGGDYTYGLPIFPDEFPTIDEVEFVRSSVAEISSRVTGQDRRRRDTARGGYFISFEEA